MSNYDYAIGSVRTTQDLTDIVALFKEYAASLNIDLSFQQFSKELSSLPGKYDAPRGLLLLARSSTGQAIGCVGVRGQDKELVCEMKRLYVSPSGRGKGLGKALALQAMEQARMLGYEHMRLDTLSTMTSARAMYGKLGFVDIEPYYDNPVEGARFLEVNLSADRVGKPRGPE